MKNSTAYMGGKPQGNPTNFSIGYVTKKNNKPMTLDEILHDPVERAKRLGILDVDEGSELITGNYKAK